MEDTIKMHERVSALEQDRKSVHRRLDNLEKLVESVHILATEMKATREEMDSFGTRLSEIEKKPQKRYNTFITACITSIAGTIVGAVAGYFIQFFG